MFGIGGFELFLILIFGFLIFGPDKLPEIAKTIGKAIAKFRNAQESMTEQLKGTTFLDKDSDNLVKNPLDVLGDIAGKSSEKDAEEKSDKDISDNEAAKDGSKSEDVKRSDSFAERKARYDRERAKRKQEEAKKAEEEKKKAADLAAAKKEAEDNPKIEIASKSVVEEGE